MRLVPRRSGAQWGWWKALVLGTWGEAMNIVVISGVMLCGAAPVVGQIPLSSDGLWWTALPRCWPCPPRSAIAAVSSAVPGACGVVGVFIGCYSQSLRLKMRYSTSAARAMVAMAAA
jgi:hypothetical protein